MWQSRLGAACVAAVLAAIPLASSVRQSGSSTDAMLVYFGAYTGEKSRSQGISRSRLDLASGKVTPPELAAETQNPSFLAVHPKGTVLYAANEVRTFEGKEMGSVSAFTIDRQSGRLTPLNQQGSGGRGPVYVVVDKSGRNVLVSNYGGGSPHRRSSSTRARACTRRASVRRGRTRST
jgi:6-phosphogluconolactonase